MKYKNRELEKAYAKKIKEIRNIKLNEKNKDKKITKKQRDHALILKGTVFERLDLMNESEEFLLGLIISAEPYDLTEEEKGQLIYLGKQFIEMRKEKLLELERRN